MKTHSFISELAQARRDLGLTLEDMSVRTGYECETLMKLECGHAKPSLNGLLRWARVLGFEVVLNRVPEASQTENVEYERAGA